MDVLLPGVAGWQPRRMQAPLLALVLLVEPFALEGTDEATDLEAAREGVAVRLGDAADDWVVRVSTDDTDVVRIELTSPHGRTLTREVVLEGDDPQARAMELAAAIAVIIETYEPPLPKVETPPPPPPPPPEHRPLGWLALGGRIGGGPPNAFHLDGGVHLGGGAWLVDDHIQPVAEVGWTRSQSGGLEVDAIRIGAGALFGGSVLRGRLWVGAGGIGGALGARARAESRASGWSGSILVPVALQARVSWLLVEAHAGPALTLPPLRFTGADRSLRWGHVRFFAGVRVGVTLGSSRPLDSTASSRS